MKRQEEEHTGDKYPLPNDIVLGANMTTIMDKREDLAATVRHPGKRGVRKVVCSAIP